MTTIVRYERKKKKKKELSLELPQFRTERKEVVASSVIASPVIATSMTPAPIRLVHALCVCVRACVRLLRTMRTWQKGKHAERLGRIALGTRAQ